jgi:hypothetical protein
MSRQLVFSSTISVMVMAAFALSTTVKAQDHTQHASVAQVAAVSGR